MKIMNKLTIKHLLMNKKRTIVTIIGIILSTALMIGIGTFASSFRNYLIKDAIESRGSHHVVIKNIPQDKLKYIENNININQNELELEQPLGYAEINSTNRAKPYLYILNVNDKLIENIKLIEGNLPKKDNEIIISNHTNYNGNANIKIGDTLKLSIGNRIVSDENENYVLDQNNPFTEEETFEQLYTKEFVVVGIMERQNKENYSAPGYTALTINNDSNNKLNAYIEYKKVKNVIKKTEDIIDTLKLTEKDIDYNDSLLVYYGETKYSNINNVLNNLIIVILSLLVVTCAIVIYNSFAISVMERKKQFGLLSSIGATREQLKRTVFFEAIIVSLIGIPIGILSGIGGIAVTLVVINQLITNMIDTELTLSLYPFYIILPIIYMIITIFISAIIPAIRASKVSPINLIRLNDDIKIKKNKIKTNKFINKIFGICGDISYKNIKRNKKKYRITVISLFISIVLFISFSTFLSVAKQSTEDVFNLSEFDVVVEFVSNKYQKNEINDTYNKIKQISDINKSVLINNLYTNIIINNKNTTDSGLDYLSERTVKKNNQYFTGISLLVIPDTEYKDYIRDNRLSDNSIVIINKLKYQDQNIKTYTIKPFKNSDDIKLYYTIYEDNKDDQDIILPYSLTLSNKEPESLQSYQLYSNTIIGVMSDSMYEKIKTDSFKTFSSIYVNTKKDVEVTKEIQKIVKYNENEIQDIFIVNYAESIRENRNIIIIISILLYGFISLVTLIGITSVFNTINTSMALRKKEFAVLRSIGLSPKQFNKIIVFESMFYGIKALFYALPVSMILVVIFNKIFHGVKNNFVIPYTAIIISILSVFIITFITMRYTTIKQRKENILDAIREENI